MNLFGDDRESLRAHFFLVWGKLQDREPLEPLEAIIAEVINMHPEYHGIIADPVANMDRDWGPEGGESNPFLHMGLHIAIKEQLTTDLPPGIAARFQAIVAGTGDVHAAEHRVLEALAETLWEAQSAGTTPDIDAYLARLDGIGGKA